MLEKNRIQCAMVNARQWGVGSSGGTEAIIHLHQGIENLYFAGKLPKPLAVVQVDQNNMFGNLEWRSIRQAMLEEVPNLAASTTWKHQQSSEVEQPGVDNYKKDRGAEQGDAAAPLEAGAVQSGIARKARARIHGEQRQGSLPWCVSTTALMRPPQNKVLMQHKPRLRIGKHAAPRLERYRVQMGLYHAILAIACRKQEELWTYGILTTELLFVIPSW